MTKLLLPMLILLAIPLFFNILSKNKTQKEILPDATYPFEKKKYLLTLAEKNFYSVLSLALEDTNYYICPKVRLADIISVGKTESRQAHFNKIKAKHIDFLLCDKDSLEPLFAIELDDSSHQKESRVKRDIFVDNALEAAGLKFERFKVQNSYAVSDIKERFDLN